MKMKMKMTTSNKQRVPRSEETCARLSEGMRGKRNAKKFKNPRHICVTVENYVYYALGIRAIKEDKTRAKLASEILTRFFDA
ncbi:MAG: hypothetical protein LUD39_00650 [Opitutae bacterium]|nr:hypothetical protein [Opitutae bacterium]